jgi:hypothetical protein
VVCDAFVVRSPGWWRDVLLGLFWGIALVWASFDALKWILFKQHLLSEAIFVAVPFLLALLSPRRLITIFVGLCVPLFRLVFVLFLFTNLWSALGVLLWGGLVFLVGSKVNREESRDIAVPDGFSGLELLLTMTCLGVGIFLLVLLRRVLALNG